MKWDLPWLSWRVKSVPAGLYISVVRWQVQQASVSTAYALIVQLSHSILLYKLFLAIVYEGADNLPSHWKMISSCCWARECSVSSSDYGHGLCIESVNGQICTMILGDRLCIYLNFFQLSQFQSMDMHCLCRQWRLANWHTWNFKGQKILLKPPESFRAWNGVKRAPML